MGSMETGPVILDISSDEEGLDYLLDKHPLPPDWISDFFGDLDEAPADPDEIVVLDELSCAAAAAPNRSITAKIEREDFGDASDDDDCVVLEGDPDEPVAVVHDKDESEELLIVGEKGDLACRDYPHSRHLCATFPFSRTPHEQHCNQCHCYVCDVVAPCAYWGNGTFATDHCHSTEKEAKWKMMRKSLKDGTALVGNVQNPATRTPIVAAASGFNPMVPAQPPLMTRTFRACSNSNVQTGNMISQRPVRQLAAAEARVHQLYHQLVSTGNAVRARQGLGLQPANPVLTNARGVPPSRASYMHTSTSGAGHGATSLNRFHTSTSGAGHGATNLNRFHRPVYPAHQTIKVVELPRRHLPAQGQGLWRNQHSTNSECQKRRIAVQEPSVFKRQRIGHLSTTLPLQENQFPSETTLDAVGLKRLNDIMSGLQSEIGLSNVLQSEIGASNINHTDNLSTAVSPFGVHPHVPVDSEQHAEVLGVSEDRVSPSLHDGYDPLYPNIGYNSSGSNLWVSDSAITSMSSPGIDDTTPGIGPQNHQEQTQGPTCDVEATSLPSISKDHELSAAGLNSSGWFSYREPQVRLDPCLISSNIPD